MHSVGELIEGICDCLPEVIDGSGADFAKNGPELCENLFDSIFATPTLKSQNNPRVICLPSSNSFSDFSMPNLFFIDLRFLGSPFLRSDFASSREATL